MTSLALSPTSPQMRRDNQIKLRRSWLGKPPVMLKDERGKDCAIRLRCPCGQHWLDLSLKHWSLTRHANGFSTVNPGILPPCECPPVRYIGGMWIAETSSIVVVDKRPAPAGFFADPLPYPPDEGQPVPYMTGWDMALLEREANGVFLTSNPIIDHPMFESARYMQIRQVADWTAKHGDRTGDQTNCILPARGLVGVVCPLGDGRDVEIKLSSRKNEFAKFGLTDGEIMLPCVAFSKSVERDRQWLRPDCPVVVHGKVQGAESDEDEQGLALELVVDSLSMVKEW